MGLHPNRQQFLAIKWLIVAARERSGKGMADKLALELLEAHNNEVEMAHHSNSQYYSAFSVISCESGVIYYITPLYCLQHMM